MATSPLPPPADAATDFPRLRETLRAFIRSRVRSLELAEDLTQDTLLRVQTRLHTLRTPERLQSWVLQIARHAIADHFRRSRDHEPFEEESHAALLPAAESPATAEDDALNQELAGYLRSVVERLPEPYRETLRLIEFDGVSQVELARRLGLSVSAAKSRIQRGRTMLRKEMERCCRWETDRYGKVLGVERRSPQGCHQDSASCCDKK